MRRHTHMIAALTLLMLLVPVGAGWGAAAQKVTNRPGTCRAGILAWVTPAVQHVGG